MDYIYLIRKLGHATVYFILTLLVLRGLKMSGIRHHVKLFAIALLISLLYAMSDEYHQSLTGFRDGRWSDVGIDSIGVSLALLAFSWGNLIWNKQEKGAWPPKT